MQGLPTGTVTFQLTDLAGSTRLGEDVPARRGSSLSPTP